MTIGGDNLMSITSVNATLIKYESSSTYTTIYPKTTASNITITANSNLSTTNLQTLIDGLGSLAFVSRTIVTTLSNVASGVLVDGAVVKSINESITTLQTTVNTLSSSIAVMTGATSSAAGKQGLVPAPSAGEESYFLRADGTWVDLS